MQSTIDSSGHSISLSCVCMHTVTSEEHRTPLGTSDALCSDLQCHLSRRANMQIVMIKVLPRDVFFFFTSLTTNISEPHFSHVAWPSVGSSLRLSHPLEATLPCHSPRCLYPGYGAAVDKHGFICCLWESNIVFSCLGTRVATARSLRSWCLLRRLTTLFQLRSSDCRFTVRSFITCTFHQILGRTNQEGTAGWGMQHAWGNT